MQTITANKWYIFLCINRNCEFLSIILFMIQFAPRSLIFSGCHGGTDVDYLYGLQLGWRRSIGNESFLSRRTSIAISILYSWPMIWSIYQAIHACKVYCTVHFYTALSVISMWVGTEVDHLQCWYRAICLSCQSRRIQSSAFQNNRCINYIGLTYVFWLL